GLLECTPERELGARALRVRSRHVVTVGRLADTAEADRGGLARQQKHAGSFADVDAATIRAERVADVGCERLERVEAVQREPAQAVRAADDDCIAAARFDQTTRGGERLRRR